MPSHDFVIGGAGIIGLAAAFELKKRHPSARILILEKENGPGMHASGRNSGVLHSGIYYSPGTLKAKMCREGARRMKLFAGEHGIACRQDGKIIAATEAGELPVLDRLMDNARANGIEARKIGESEVRDLEPHARIYQAAIHCPEVAVIDSPGVVKKLASLLIASGVEVRFGEAVRSLDPAAGSVRTVKEDYGFGYFLNCTGAYADRVARLAGLAGEYILVPFKGFYYKLSPSRASLVRASIYPVPNPDMPFLGVHFTRVVQGDVYIGPTAVPALGRENYHGFSGIRAGESAEVFVQLARMYLSPDPMFRRLVHQEFSSYLKSVYTARARKLVPEVRSEDLQTCSKVGIRPQLVNRKTGKLEMDYVIQKAGRTLHVLNAISPAFTCAFAFAEYLVKEMEGMPA